MRSTLRVPAWVNDLDSRGFRVTRLVTTALVALVGGALTWWAHRDGSPSDFYLISSAARVLLAGGNPYDVIGPGKTVDWSFPLLYPLPAFLIGVPFVLTPWPDVLFASAGAGAFAWAAWKRPLLWWAVPTPAWQLAVQMGQWAPLLVCASLYPWLGALLTCKPSIGAALWVGRPTVRAVVSGLLMLGLSILILPSWPLAWLATLRETSHMEPPVLKWGGVLVLAALWRWRLPEARVLAALACVPQTAHVYDILPLFLVPRTHRQGALLAALSWAFVLLIPPALSGIDPNLDPRGRYMAIHQILGQWTVLVLYLPCLAMVLWPSSRQIPKDRAP
jgi:hypothetical protein